MSRLLRSWRSLTAVATLRSRRSWTRWRQSLAETLEWRRTQRLRRRRARAARRHRLLQELTAEQLLRVQRLEQRLYPAMTVVHPQPPMPTVLEMVAPLLQEELDRLRANPEPPLPATRPPELPTEIPPEEEREPAEREIARMLGLPQAQT